MRFALLVALLPALAGAGDDADKLFREVEKKIASAKSLRVVSDFAVEERGKEFKIEGTLDLAGDKMRMRLSGNIEGKEMKMSMVSDGKKMVSAISDAGGTKEQAAPKKLHELATKLLSRAGLAGSMFIVRRAGPGAAEEPDPDKLFAVRDFKAGKAVKVNDRDTKVLHYRLDIDGEKEKAEITLWVDARTLLPVKRLISAGEGKTKIVETYREFKLDPKLDAKTFELPKS